MTEHHSQHSKLDAERRDLLDKAAKLKTQMRQLQVRENIDNSGAWPDYFALHWEIVPDDKWRELRQRINNSTQLWKNMKLFKEYREYWDGLRKPWNPVGMSKEKQIFIAHPVFSDRCNKMPRNPSILLWAMFILWKPVSQTEVAKAVKANQNQIAQAYKWLITNGVIEQCGLSEDGKRKLFRVKNRLFIDWYCTHCMPSGSLYEMT